MAQFKQGKNWIEVDEKLYTPIDQGMVILKIGEGNDEAKAFYDFMMSDKAREILINFGYRVK
jgi:molybdate transport system substrate-binding protein